VISVCNLIEKTYDSELYNGYLAIYNGYGDLRYFTVKIENDICVSLGKTLVKTKGG